MTNFAFQSGKEETGPSPKARHAQTVFVIVILNDFNSQCSASGSILTSIYTYWSSCQEEPCSRSTIFTSCDESQRPRPQGSRGSSPEQKEDNNLGQVRRPFGLSKEGLGANGGKEEGGQNWRIQSNFFIVKASCVSEWKWLQPLLLSAATFAFWVFTFCEFRIVSVVK